MQITDNALSNIDYKKIYQYFTSEMPNWHFMPGINDNVNRTEQPKYKPTSWGFSCNISNTIADIKDKHAYRLLEPLILNKEKLVRIRCGFIVNVGPSKLHRPHIDQPLIKHITQLYYLTDSDAVTNVFEEYGNDSKYDSYKPEDFTVKFLCKPEKNRMFIFDGMHWHSSSPVLGKEARLVLSINYAK